MVKNKLLSGFVLGLLMASIIPLTVSADMGPKPKLIVHVKNPPDELYYLDLLTSNPGNYENYKPSQKEALNQDMVSLLYSYEDKGWLPALLEGTRAPMWGNPIGESSGKDRIHTFGYHGLPDRYRIIIVTQNGKVTVSDVYTRQSLQSNIAYDYASGKIKIPSVYIAYIVQFLTTFLFTILIEGCLLLLFRFSLKENYKVFLLINFATQLLLTATLGTALIHSGTISAYFVQFPIEIVIMITETLVYGRYLKGKTKKSRYLYGVVANLSSWAAGFFSMDFIFELLMKQL